MTYNEVTVQSRLQLQNENDTNILFALNERLVLDRDLRQITIDGSGATGATDTTGALQTTLATDIIGTSISSAELTLTSRISIWSDLPPLGTDTRTDVTATTISDTESTLSTDSILGTTTDTSSAVAIDSSSSSSSGTTEITTDTSSTTTIDTSFSTTETTADAPTTTTIDTSSSTADTSSTTTTSSSSSTTETSSETISSTSSGGSTTLSTTTPPMTTTPDPSFCKNISHFFQSGQCRERNTTREDTINTLQNTTNSSVIAEQLSLYIGALTDSNVSSTSQNTLTLDEIDGYLTIMNSTDLTKETTDSILVATSAEEENSIIVVGASFTTGVGGNVINSSNINSVHKPNVSAAAILSKQSLIGVRSLNVLIIDKPTTYINVDNTTNKTLASSIIMVTWRGNNATRPPIDISLYFKVLSGFEPKVPADYFCSFYDTANHVWNESGCTKPAYDEQFKRYECRCNHTTTFALVWLPKVPLTRYLNSQDIASLVFQSISICCFIATIIHAIVIRFRDPIMSLQTYDLLPLMSYAATMIVFIFFIALAMTTYAKTSSEDQTSCFLSSSVLMFFVYFFLIFMFCTKTSLAYFNYLRFVRLFPAPSYRRLFIMILISFFISIIWVSVAAGLNSNPSYNITQLYPYKLCWFTRDVIYYFLTIPVGVFLFLNILIFIIVTHRIIKHVRNATSPHQSYERMKRCVIILLLSSVTQGIGWIFGPFLTIVDEKAGNILGWFFIIFNGLEGLWIILLYLLIRSQHMDEQKRSIAAAELTKSTTLTSNKRKNNSSGSWYYYSVKRNENIDRTWEEMFEDYLNDPETATGTASVC
ncbi:unnamed protein product [Rotaria socialis]